EFGGIQALAPSLGVQVSPVNVRNANEIESGIATFARTANGGLIVTGSATATIHRHLILKLAAQYNLPAIYANRPSVVDGGLISYEPDRVDEYRRAASYVDRVLKGESRPTCRCRRQPSTNWSSISRPRERSPSTCRPRCSPLPTRGSNDAPRVHHAARRRGGVAARGACAATREHAACGASRCSACCSRTMRNGRPASRRSCRINVLSVPANRLLNSRAPR